MKINMPFYKRLILPYRDFIQRVNGFHWEKISHKEMKLKLKHHQKDTAEVYSLIKEVIFRCKGVKLFDCQIAAAYAMEQGNIAQLDTGEGKTLAAVVAAVSMAIRGQKVHIFVFNDYLARRDYEENKEIYCFCGITADCILAEHHKTKRKEAYGCSVLYITAKEAGFDYLRNFLASTQEELLDIPFHRAIIDEADSILIDEAKVPLVIAGELPEALEEIIETAKKCVSYLKKEHIDIQWEAQQVWLNEEGISTVEKAVAIENLFCTEHNPLLAMVHIMLEAKYFYKRDRDYIVKNHRICVVDCNTGRVVKNRKFPNFLHRAIEIKEGLEHHGQSMILNMIPLQFFLLHYDSLCGMTGTAWSARKELQSMYGLEVVRIPPNMPCKRIDHPHILFSCEEKLQKMIVHKILEIHSKGQPVLLAAQNVEESEHYAKLLKKAGLDCCILNARYDEEEAALIKQAGKPYQVTVSTNMAGRGVDIKLEDKKAVDAGGLFVLSAGINRSKRIDDQLRGRAGRQGQPGESQFFISLEQDFFHGHRKNKQKEDTFIKKVQKAVEGEDAQRRYILEKYSVIIEKQRQIITEYREKVLCSTEEHVSSLKQQLLLYYINQHWADYLLTMEGVRDGIHLTILGNEDPLEVYQKFAVSAFDEMKEDIETDVMKNLKRCENGSIQKFSLKEATNTCSYEINESKGQFMGFGKSNK